MKTRARYPGLAAIFLSMFLSALIAQGQDVKSNFYKFGYDAGSGKWDLRDANGAVILKNAFARAILDAPDSKTGRIITSANAVQINFQEFPINDQMGSGAEIRVKSRNPGEPALVNIFRFYKDKEFVLASMEIADVPEGFKGWRVEMLEPMVVEGPSGGLFLGKNPARHKILDNGSNWWLDFMVSLFGAGSQPLFPANLFGADSRSDWSSIIYDPERNKSAIAGFLTGDAAGNIVLAGYNPAESMKERGGAGFSIYAGQSIYRPPIPIKDGFSSEVLYLDFFSASPFDALENYADAVAKWNNIQLWPGPTPTGWNSWGGYIHAIDEQTVLQNLKFASERFKPFGMNYFQIDDGYQPHWGDWEADPQKFPHGMKWLADQIRGEGMIPGIWIAPFEADIHSEIYKRHPEWFLPLKGLVASFIINKDLRVLDLSKPEAREFLRSTVRKYVKDWGYKWIKVDFEYYVLAYSHAGDDSRTVFDLYREGMKIIKEEAGPDVFVVGIGIVPVNYGIVDGMRLGLDNMPVWNNHRSDFDLKKFTFAQGLAPSARVVARRYWMNYRIWINHPDLIFFNNDRIKEIKAPPLTMDESLCFANVVGLSGGIVKIGDKMAEMKDAEVAVVQKLLPAYPHSGRPIDLFEKATPEIWHLPVKTNFDSWDVVGLFNWGKNWEGRKAIPEKTRAISIKISALGLDPSKKFLAFDFWNENFLGVIQKELSVSLKPRSSAMVALRELQDHPQFLSYNRHITQGAIDMKNIVWDPASKTLAGVQDAVPGFEYHLYFYRPDGFVLAGAKVSADDYKIEQSDNLIKLGFVAKTRPVSWTLNFN